MDIMVRIMWIWAVIQFAIGGGIAVSYISKVGVKKVICFVIVSTVIAFIMYAGVNQLCIYFKPDDPIGNPVSAVFGGVGFWGSMVLQKSYHDDKNVMKN